MPDAREIAGDGGAEWQLLKPHVAGVDGNLRVRTADLEVWVSCPEPAPERPPASAPATPAAADRRLSR